MFDLRTLSEVRDRLTAAENAGDSEPICAAMGDDIVLMVPSAPVQEGKAACAAFLRELLPRLAQEFDRQITYTSTEVRVLGDVAFDLKTQRTSAQHRELANKVPFHLKGESGRQTKRPLQLTEDQARVPETLTPITPNFWAVLSFVVPLKQSYWCVI
jgi:ketosteroid isomerase-like protein